MPALQLTTIGFTKKTAEHFFTTLQAAGVRRVLDVRLNNESQLAGFSKKNDLVYFLQAISKIEYMHLPILAPTPDLLHAFKNTKIAWDEYEKSFLELLSARRIEQQLDPALLNESCLLCSEAKPHHCHRRLVAEYLKEKWGDLSIEHLE